MTLLYAGGLGRIKQLAFRTILLHQFVPILFRYIISYGGDKASLCSYSN